MNPTDFSAPWQVPCDLDTVRVRRVASALVAAASDAVVCLHVDEAERAFAESLGLAVAETPAACRRALRHGGLALLDARAFPLATDSGVARVLAHPAGPTRVVLSVGPGEAVPAAKALRAAGVDSAVVLDPSLAAERRVCRLVAGSVRIVDPGRAVPLSAAPVDPPSLVAALCGVDLPVADMLAWEAAAVLWVGGWLPRFEDILGWTRSRLRAGIDLRVHGGRRVVPRVRPSLPTRAVRIETA